MTAVQSRLVVIIDSLNSVIRHSSFVNGLLLTVAVSLTKGTPSTKLVARGYAPVRNALNRYFGRNKVVDGRIQSKTNQSARDNWFTLAEISTVDLSPSVTKGEKILSMEATDKPLSQDVVFELLSSPRRRYILYYLRKNEEPVELTTLAEYVAAWENETDVDSITEQERKRVYVSLYQTHIPRLDEAGVIEYDSDSGLVSLASDATKIDSYLDSTESRVPWQWIYLLLAVVSATLLGLTTAQVGPFDAVSESIVTLSILVAFTITAVAHTVYRMMERRSIPEELQQRL